MILMNRKQRAMKKYILNIFVVFLAMMAFVACEDDNGFEFVNGGTPVVNYVKSPIGSTSDSLIVEAYLGSQIAIIGEDLAGVNKIYFNDQQAKLNPTYVTDNAIIVTIPDDIPLVKDDYLKLYTSEDSCYYSFESLVPAPSVESMTLEYVYPGDTAHIAGLYFVEYDESPISVMFTGNVEGEVLSCEETSIDVIVPEGAQAGPISVTTVYGSGSSLFEVQDETNRFITGDNTSNWDWWGTSSTASADGIDGTYLTFSGTAGDWSWNDDLKLGYFSSTSESLVSEPEGSITNYALKFEFKSVNWHDTPLCVWFDDADPSSSEIDIDGDDAQYHWRPYLDDDGNVSNYTTDWITVTLPLEDFKYSKDESEASRSIGSFDQLINLNLMWFGAADGDGDDYSLEVYMDNFRIVPIE